MFNFFFLHQVLNYLSLPNVKNKCMKNLKKNIYIYIYIYVGEGEGGGGIGL